MPFVLTEASSVTCTSGGTVQKTGTPKLTVGGSNALLTTSLGAVSGCPIVTDTNTGAIQCLAFGAIDNGPASKLTVGGIQVLLDTLSGKTGGKSSTGVLEELGASANQSKLSAV